MHGFLLALTLAAYLLAPSSFLTRLWSLPSGRSEAPASKPILEKGGPGLDPDGFTGQTTKTDAGPGLDPSGHS